VSMFVDMRGSTQMAADQHPRTCSR
jgi:hypothetical protein